MIKTIQEQEDREYQEFLRNAEDKEYQEFLQNSDILPTPEEIATQTSNPLKNLNINPYLLSALGGLVSAVNTPIGLGIGVVSLGYQIAKDVKEGNSLSDAFLNAGAIALSFGGGATAKALKFLKNIKNISNFFQNKDGGKFVDKGIEILEKQHKGEKISEATLKNFEKISKTVKVNEKAQEKIFQYMKENKNAYDKEVKDMLFNEETKLELMSNFDRFLEEQGQNLGHSNQWKPAIKDIKNYLSEQNLSDIGLLSKYFEHPELFPSIQSKALPPPLKTPLERAIYEAIFPKLQNPQSKIAMNFLYPKQSQAQKIVEQLQNYQKAQQPNQNLLNLFKSNK